MNTVCRKPVLYMMKTDSFQDPSVFARCLALLPEARRHKVLAFWQEKDRMTSLAASLALLHVLKNTGLSEDEMRFSCSEYGKPFLENHPLYFNLSHSGNAGICAAGPGVIGCDIEALRPPVMAIARLHFCPEEYRYLNSLTDPGQQSRAFCRFWTLKESVIKALGGGLTIPLDSFRISFDTDETHVKTNQLDQTVYYKEYDAGNHCFVSCSAFDRKDLPAQLTRLNLSDLI